MSALGERLRAGDLEPRVTAAAVRRRLLPLYAALFLQNLALWVPIEKLFMTSIGFDAAGVGLMAAVYAAVVPLFEVPPFRRWPARAWRCSCSATPGSTRRGRRTSPRRCATRYAPPTAYSCSRRTIPAAALAVWHSVRPHRGGVEEPQRDGGLILV